MLEKRIDRLLKGNYRFLLAPLLLMLLKILGSIIIYRTTGLPAGKSFWMNPNKMPGVIQNEILLENANRTNNFLYTFVGWDTAWYLSIAFRGYDFHDPSFAFRPLLPYISRGMNYLFSNQVLSIVAVALVSGVLWVPIFQRISEMYMSRFSAMVATLIFAVSPFTFLFTTVAYSEGIFLLFTLGALFYFKRGNCYIAAALSFLSALTRPPGFLIALPMLLEGLRDIDSLKLRKIFTSFSPILASGLWSFYGLLSVGRFNPWIYVTEWDSVYTFLTYLMRIVPSYGLRALSFPHENITTINILPIFIWFSLFAPLYPIYKLFELDKPLFFYSVFYFLGVFLFGAVFSYPRFFTFLFPIWLTLDFEKIAHRRNIPVLIFFYIIASFLISLYLWWGFVTGLFVS